MLYLQLFWEFFKTGLFAVGGGLATLPFLQDMADRTGWFTSAQLADMLAVSESTPGPIGVNMATYVGFTTGGVGGALMAVLMPDGWSSRTLWTMARRSGLIVRIHRVLVSTAASWRFTAGTPINLLTGSSCPAQAISTRAPLTARRYPPRCGAQTR